MKLADFTFIASFQFNNILPNSKSFGTVPRDLLFVNVVTSIESQKNIRFLVLVYSCVAFDIKKNLPLLP